MERAEYFQKLKDHYRENTFKEGNKLVNHILKRMGPFSSSEKIIIGVYFSNSGKSQKALKVYGNELTADEVAIASRNDLRLQTHLASQLHVHGARYSCERIMKNVEEEAKKRGKTIPDINRASLLFEVMRKHRDGFHDVAVSMEKDILDVFAKDHEFRPLSYNWVISSYDALGQYDVALKLAQNELAKTLKLSPEKKLFHAPLMRAVAEIQNNMGIRPDLTPIQNVIKGLNRNSNTKLEVELLRVTGISHFLFGKKEDAIKAFREATDIAVKVEGLAAGLLGPLFWMEMLDQPEPFEGAYKVLRTHQSFNTYSYMKGRRYKGTTERNFFSWCEKYKTDQTGDCWIIEGNNAILADYKQTVEHLWNSKNISFLDLNSGVLYEPGKEVSFLTGLQNHCLAQIVSCMPLGISKWTLADKLYQVDLFDHDHLLNRLKNLIHGLKKLGFNTRTEKNYIKVEDIKYQKVILPNPPTPEGIHAFLESIGPSFSIQELEKFFSLDSSTIYRKIKEWKELKVCFEEKTSECVRFHFERQSE